MDSQDQLYLELLYPPITRITDFVSALPDCVVESVIIAFRLRDKFAMDLDTKRTYMRILLLQPKNNPKITPIIWEVLARYHNIQP